MQSQLHSSFGKSLETCSIAVIGANRPSISLTRTMLSMCGVRHVNAFESAVQALNHLIAYHVDLVLVDERCSPITGANLIKVMRHYLSEPLCFMPSVILSSQPTQHFVAHATRMGAQLVLGRPLSPEMLKKRLEWVLRDKRQLILENDRWVIEGAIERTKNAAQNRLLPVLMSQLGLAPDRPDAKARAAQALIDNILGQGTAKRAA